jgi:Rieske Fe-S protein
MTQQIPRRAAVGFVAVGAACAACARYGGPQFPEEAADNKAATQTAGEVLGKAADIPVGGGKVFPDKKLVVTQPEAGQFKGFSAVCTHQGCLVDKVAGGTIDCPCHGSKFKVADGSVSTGPAAQPLPPAAVRVNEYGELVTGGDLPPETTAPETTAPETTAPETTAPDTTAPDTTAPGGGGAKGLASTGEIPVGGGKILPDEEIVITQPSPGKFMAFSAVCTHQGCLVDKVAGGTIDCPCHGSKFKLDGSVANGPAAAPLSARAVKVSGDQISLA